MRLRNFNQLIVSTKIFCIYLVSVHKSLEFGYRVQIQGLHSSKKMPLLK
jgi:hypothetical protein